MAEQIRIPESLLRSAPSEAAVYASSCTTECEVQFMCPDGCMWSCMSCETSSECGNCENNCQSSCQFGCEGNSEGCTTTCEYGSQSCGSCESCQGCEHICESISQVQISSGSITGYSVTSNSITVSYSSIVGANFYQVVYRVDGDSTLNYAGTTSALSYTITGLEPDTAYVVNYRGGAGDTWGAFMPSGVIITTSSARPGDWEWYSIIRSGMPIRLGAVEWNDFLDRINEFRSYVGIAQYGSFVYANPGDMISTSICQHAVWAIRAMNPPIYTNDTPQAGSPISASFFINLQESLNSIP